MGDDKELKSRIVGEVKAESGDCVTKPMNVKEYQATVASEEEKAEALEENTIGEVDPDTIGDD
jgi:hypothetical protein